MPAATPRRLDVTGTFCPLPILLAAREMLRLNPGDLLEITGDDPAILEDMPIWCERAGHRLLQIEDREGQIVSLVEKGVPSPKKRTKPRRDSSGPKPNRRSIQVTRLASGRCFITMPSARGMAPAAVGWRCDGGVAAVAMAQPPGGRGAAVVQPASVAGFCLPWAWVVAASSSSAAISVSSSSWVL